MKENLKRSFRINEVNNSYPTNVGQAVQHLLYNLPFREKVEVAVKTERKLSELKNSLGKYIQHEFGLDANMSLIESCLLHSQSRAIDSEDACQIIIKAFWKQLKVART